MENKRCFGEMDGWVTDRLTGCLWMRIDGMCVIVRCLGECKSREDCRSRQRWLVGKINTVQQVCKLF